MYVIRYVTYIRYVIVYTCTKYGVLHEHIVCTCSSTVLLTSGNVSSR